MLTGGSGVKRRGAQTWICQPGAGNEFGELWWHGIANSLNYERQAVVQDKFSNIATTIIKIFSKVRATNGHARIIDRNQPAQAAWPTA